MASTDDIFATHALLEAFETVPELHGATVTQILARSSGLRTVYQGLFRNQPAIFRHQSGPDAAKIIQTELAEINRVQGWMAEGDNRAINVLYVNPEIGLLILSQTTGLSLRHAIKAKPEERLHLVQRAAEWLRAYSDPSRKSGPFPETRFTSRLPQIIDQKLDRKYQGLWTEVRDAMAGFETGGACILAQTHGDFHPSNIVIDQNYVTGFDLGGSHFMVLAKDVSRFLVALQISASRTQDELHFGVVKSEFDLFCDVLDFDDRHRKAYLPFLIGFDILHRGPHRNKASDDRIKRSVVLARNYLKDAKLG